MKRLLAFLAATILLLATVPLAGCAPADATPTGGTPSLRIVASFYPVYIASLQLTKDVPDVQVTLLVPPSTGCLHDYALTGGDLKTLTAADILVVNGSGMEGFLTDLAKSFPKLIVIESSRGIVPVLDPLGAVDPHVWASPKGAVVQLEDIAQGLSAADPAHAALYAANAARYGARLEALDRKASTALAPYRGVKMLSGHSSFLYFARDYGFEVIGIFGLDDGQTIGSGDLARMIDDAKAQKASLLVTDPQYPAVAGETVARETGLPACTFDAVAGGTLEGAAAMDDYLTRMEANVDRMVQALEAT